MLAASTYRLLGNVMRLSSLFVQRINDGAAPSEVSLLAESARDAAQHLSVAIGASNDKAFEVYRRHVHWIDYFFTRGQEDRYEQDLESLLSQDLPQILEVVEAWERDLLDAGLVQTISQ